MKPYRIVARVKNNRLWAAIRQSFPDVTTQSDAAHRLGVWPSELGRVLNMVAWPCRDGRWTKLARQLSDALGEPPEFLFDPVLYGRPARQIEFEVGIKELQEVGILALPPTPEEQAEILERNHALAYALGTLPPRQEQVLRLRFGLGDLPPQEHATIGAMLDPPVSPKGAAYLEKEGLRKMRRRCTERVVFA